MPPNNIRPRLSLLSPDQIEQVHAAALQILSTTGVRVDSDPLRALLAKNQAQVQDRLVRFPGELVEWALHSAPSDFQIYDRLGQPAFRVNDGQMHFGVGVTALQYQDPLTDALTPFTRRNMAELARLGSSLPNYEMISTIGIVQDVPAEHSDLYGSLELLANTTKPLVLLVSDENMFGPVLELFTHLHGRLDDRPFLLPYFNPVSPLVLNAGTLEKMQEAIWRGLPVIFSNYGMAGASTPITPAGTLALLLAELLAGLTISQVIRPGAPVVLGMLPVYFDMKSMVNFYDPQSILLNLACSEMMAHYHLPHCGTSGSGTGWGADLIAADTYWMNTLTFNLAHGGLAPFVGDTLGSKAISPNTLVYAHEVIEQSRRLAQGFQFDETHAGLAEIDRVKPGGSFLGAPSTRSRYKNAYYTSRVFPRWSMEKWMAAGQPSAESILRQTTAALLEAAQPPFDQAELLARGEAWIAKFNLERK